MGKPKPSAPGLRKGNKAGAAAKKPAPSKKRATSKPAAARSSTAPDSNDKNDANAMEQDQDDAPAADAPVPAHLQPRKPRTASHKKGGKMIASTDAMMALISEICDEQESQESAKLEKAQEKLDFAEQRQAKREQKQQEKKNLLNKVKNKLKQKTKSKPKRLQQSQAPRPASNGKKVSFAT
ncbi:hypothetical protein AMAG_00072 [Allomyces macrogynus ATCC 38327]|uniref:Uncharacterized protein n=1 Tax=Allomyces macrogynus (strain ATCC 38327) TaxID=578462 RepID=A0A0L0RVB2_ALLM3|nr:hypothetical protein AMAG_00072 [Allomyces macrogynus ATCC 38327]|eukprot:KNE54069.1 hypothetical protein AMAG_00072 [Allomyces macrogynus ATCC 38327]